jgi:SAM-dependent methyltransferase
MDSPNVDIRQQMENIYRNMKPEDIPWNQPDPPELLVEAVRTGKIKPCRAADLGCGAGNYAVWMAQQGFDMTGIDISTHAQMLARALAEEKNVSCRFVEADLLDGLDEFHESFDFAYDYELLHHIYPEDRPAYVKTAHNVLKPGSLHLSVCFSEQDPGFGSGEKFRTTPIGTVLYFSSEKELKKLFEPYFEILELTTREIQGKRAPHMANVAWLKRK